MIRQTGFGLAATSIVLGSVGVQPAKSVDDCDIAIAEARYQIENVNTQVVRIQAHDMREWSYSNHPKDYPIRVDFNMNGPGSASVMSSSVFLTNLSYDIIMACEPVSIVSFGVDGTDWGRDYG